MAERYELGSVIIRKWLFEEDIIVSIESETPDGDQLALVDALGMIELGKDSLLRASQDEG